VTAPDDERAAFARLEAELAADDPGFARRLARSSVALGAPVPPLVVAYRASAVAAVVTLALAVGLDRYPLLLITLAFAAVATAGWWSSRADRRRRSRSVIARVSDSLAAERPRNEDDLLLDPVGAVVVGCDGEPAGDAALRFAASEARRRDSVLLVVIVFSPPVDPDVDDFDTPPAAQRARARAKAERALQRAAPDPPRHQVIAVAGLPGRVLRDHFPEAALIVIGARHKHLLAALTTAESTEHLLAGGTVPLVVVPPGWPG
jgi:nucleotide-binding universal stress UspA family protein